MTRFAYGLASFAISSLATAPSAQFGASFEPEMLDLERAALQSLTLPATTPSSFHVDVVIDGAARELVFHRESLRSGGFQLLVEDEAGIAPHEPAPVVTYKGAIAGLPDSVIAGSLLDDGLHAVVLIDELIYGIQPAPGGNGLHAVYDARDALPSDVGCGGALHVPGAGVVGGPGSVAAADGANGGTQVVQIGMDTDNQFYLAQGSSIAASQQEVETILNAVEAIYTAQFGIEFEVTVIIVRTSEPDGYTGDIFSRLDQQLNAWTGPLAEIPRDISQLFTGIGVDSGVIGLAYLNAVCEFDFGYGANDVEWTDNFSLKTTLVAHELGHNFGSNHCDGTSDCAIMCSFIAGCDPDTSAFGSFALGEINSYVSGIDCLSDPGPCGFVSAGLTAGNEASLAAIGPATPGSTMTLVHANPGASSGSAFAAISGNPGSAPFGPGTALIDLGTILTTTSGVTFSSQFSAETEGVDIPDLPILVGAVFYAQAVAFDGGGNLEALSNRVDITVCP